MPASPWALTRAAGPGRAATARSGLRPPGPAEPAAPAADASVPWSIRDRVDHLRESVAFDGPFVDSDDRQHLRGLGEAHVHVHAVTGHRHRAGNIFGGQIGL